MRKRLTALETITKRLESDLGNQLGYSAPLIDINPPERQARISVEGQLWYSFARLNAVLTEMEVHQIRAMPAHERVARFKSALLTNRLTGQAEINALAQLGVPGQAGRRVYQLSPDSREVKAKDGDFSFALAPANQIGFLDRRLASLVSNTQLSGQYGNDWNYIERVTNVTVVKIDRNQGLIVLDVNRNYPTIVDELRNSGIVNLDQDAVLDPVSRDFFTEKLKQSLRSIGNPPVAANHPLTQQALFAVGQRALPARPGDVSATADLLWDANALGASSITRNLQPVRAQLTTHGIVLNQSQWQAWEDALTHRARLVWGPPGTGKSQTLRAIVIGAILEAHLSSKSLRVLVCASTYTAIDNVLLGIGTELNAIIPGSCSNYRIRSVYQSPPGNISPTIDAELSRANPSSTITGLRSQLQSASGLVVVGSTPEQVHNLLTCGNGEPLDEWFDLIVIDEASQMDVGHAVLPFCGIAANGSVVLAGDPLQLPPIHQAEAPEGLADVVGSIYRFYERVHGVPVSPLDINYRSNDTIVEFARQSGYRAALTSNAPNLQIGLTSALPSSQPENWPATLYWCSDWNFFLDPAQPATCFVYDDRSSSQMNVFEADAVASIIWLLEQRLSNNLVNDPGQPPANWSFWTHGVGIVTPHRAQQGLIVSQLQALFGATGQVADEIREAVDTVERFQGQQRDVIIASFALGDPDQIEDEEEFLLSLNRFNVMASRARAKLIVLVSRQVVDHLANEVEVLHDSRLLKVFVETFCNNSQAATLGHMTQGGTTTVNGEIRWH